MTVIPRLQSASLSGSNILTELIRVEWCIPFIHGFTNYFLRTYYVPRTARDAGNRARCQSPAILTSIPCIFPAVWVTGPNPPTMLPGWHFCQQVHCWLQQMEAPGEPGGGRKGEAGVDLLSSSVGTSSIITSSLCPSRPRLPSFLTSAWPVWPSHSS